MDIENIRKECTRLIQCRNLADSIDLLNIYQEYIFKVIVNQENDRYSSEIEKDANVLNQMIFTKICYILNAVKGISYESSSGYMLNNIIDPTIVANLIRNVYETTCAFHLIYVKTKNEEERKIVYNMWVHSGLKYRRNFEKFITTEENREKFNGEAQQMITLENDIKATSVFSNLTVPNQDKIINQLKIKDYKIVFNGNDVNVLNWKNAIQSFEFQNDIMDEIYTYFSLYAHPSNVSVFQFHDMFYKGYAHHLNLTNHNLSYLFIFLSAFVSDYIKVFPSVLEVFNNIELRDQVVIDFKNFTMRGKEHSINNSWEKLE